MNPKINCSNHLTDKNRINLGSFYTPHKYVKLIEQWLSKEQIDSSYVIGDLTCGGGAFFKLKDKFAQNKFIGNDIDEYALNTAKTYFPFVTYSCLNAFSNVCRVKFGIKSDKKLIIVGNPPYNDTTSLINGSLKKELFHIDEDIKTRDLGISALLSYNKLNADYVAVLHPLSYLIKQANFKVGERFFKNYKILDHVVFNSQEFENTSKLSAFPVIAVLYKRQVSNGLNYQSIKTFQFHTIEGISFSLKDRDYISDYIEKYPHKKRYTPEILFYTQRDINALKRGKTFLTTRTSAAVDVNPKQLPLYCYLDCFKRYAVIPYFLGNFNVPFIKNEFQTIEKDVVTISRYYHQNIFGESKKPEQQKIENVRSYIEKVVSFI